MLARFAPGPRPLRTALVLVALSGALSTLVLAGCGTRRNAEPGSSAGLGAPRGERSERARASSTSEAPPPPSVDEKSVQSIEEADDRRATKKEETERLTTGPAPVAAPRAVGGGTPPDAPRDDFSMEAYDHVVENRFVSAKSAPLSTFSIDVDTASYSNVRRFLGAETKPPAGAVRIEELVNYFDYDYPAPKSGEPFSVHTEVGPAPWAPEHRLLHVGLKGREIPESELPPRNLVFLVDVSGSMQDENKLPLLKRSFLALLETLGEKDHVSLVVYAGSSGVVLPPTAASNRAAIREALARLEAGGSTNGAEGIELAYEMAARHFQAGGVNRVILATDGDFNVGTTSESELVRLIEKKRETGVFLTVLGYGMGNYQDSTLEKLADFGNGNYAYIDSYDEARKVLVEEGGANLVTIATDVKIQVEMNPLHVGAYRLVGYENRLLRTEDFRDDRKDAGDIGAGHTVTALYEILTPEQARQLVPEEELRYQTVPRAVGSPELATVKLRYKKPGEKTSQLVAFPVERDHAAITGTSEAFRFSAAVASFGMLLCGSTYAGHSSFGLVQDLARDSLGADPRGERREFLGLVAKAEALGR